MSNRVRLVGGSHGGSTFTTDRPVIQLPTMKNCDFPPPIGPDTTKDIERETYRVEEIRLGTGHSHRYGVLDGMRLVDALNVMWNAYEDSQRR